MMMPGDTSAGSGTSYYGEALESAVKSGQVPASRVDDMARRVLAAWFKMGQDRGFPQPNIDMFNKGISGRVNVQADHYKIIREVGAHQTNKQS